MRIKRNAVGEPALHIKDINLKAGITMISAACQHLPSSASYPHYFINIFVIPISISIFLKDFISISILIFFRIAL